MNLANRLKAIKPSPTLALNAKAKALVAQGVDVVSFAAGEPDFDTPDFIKQAAIEALTKGFTKYTPTAGIPELREAICAKLERDNHLTFAPEQVLVSVGAKHSLYNIFQALLNEGDEVIILSPYWVSYPEMVQLAGGKPVIIETREEDGFAPDPEAIRKALSPRTKALIINSPSNPSGVVLSRDTLTKIAEAVRGHECLLVSDDIYEKLLYTGEFANIGNVAPDLVPRLVLVNGMSKAFSMTGWRLGYTAGPKWLISGMQMIQDQSTSNPSSFSQKAAVVALKGPESMFEPMVKEYRARRDLVVESLNAMKGVRCREPEGAIYVLPNISGLYGRSYKGTPLQGSLQVSEILLNDFRVAAVPGAPFGVDANIRLSFATSREQLRKGLERFREFTAAVG
jgi:aspartate aminotransferase